MDTGQRQRTGKAEAAARPRCWWLPPARWRHRRDGRRRRQSAARLEKFIASLEALGSEELQERFARADQYLRDAGVYYRVYDRAGANEREWPLAHVPLLVDEAEWQASARA